MLLKGKKRHTCSIYRTGIGFKKQQTNQREAKVTENENCSADTTLFNPETLNCLRKSLR